MLITLLLTATAAINVGEARPLPVVLLAPTGALSAVDASALFRGLSVRIEPKTALKIEPLEPERVAECAGEISCLIERTGSSSPLLLVISAVKAKNGDRVSATLVDADLAREEMKRLERPGRTDRESLEAAVSERAILVRPQWIEVQNAAGLELLLDRLVTEQLRPVLVARGAWEPHAELVLKQLPAGTAIAIDGAQIGFAEPESTRIFGLDPGKRSVGLEHPEREPQVIEVELLRGRSSEVSVELVRARADAGALRAALLWSGVGAAAVGTGLVAYGAANAGETEVVCLTDDPSASRCSGSSAFYEVGGVPIAPLGLSLIAAGATWSLGTLLFGDDRDVPWLQLIVGTGIGAAVFTASVLFDGEKL